MEKDIRIRAEEHMKSRMEDLAFLYNYESPADWDIATWDKAQDFDITKEMGETEIEECLWDYRANYGLSFDYVPAGTFDDQKSGYFRYQISWGGPSEEIRFYVGYDQKPYQIEFWFLDWFTGHGIELTGKNLEIAEAIFEDFESIGMVESTYNEAMEDE
jgi:hypothetical protein